MSIQNDLKMLQSSLPFIKKWIDDLLNKNVEVALPVLSLGFFEFNKIFGDDIVNKSKFITSNNIPFPPLDSIESNEIAQLENMSSIGITYKNTYFISKLDQNINVHFHEMVHVVQWDILGVDKFLLLYGIGIIQYGYRNSPLEKMAYSLEEIYRKGLIDYNIIETIRKETNKIWLTVEEYL